MILSRRFRIASLLLVLLLLSGPLAGAAHRPFEAWQLRFGIAELVSEAWTCLSRISERATGPTVPLRKAGSQTDPFGNPAPSSQPSSGTSAESSGK
jgi:hypothetical protein